MKKSAKKPTLFKPSDFKCWCEYPATLPKYKDFCACQEDAAKRALKVIIKWTDKHFKE